MLENLNKFFFFSLMMNLSLFALEIIPAPTEILIDKKTVNVKEIQEKEYHSEILPNEAYEIMLKNNQLKIYASSKAGFFYARQTLRQIFTQAKNGTIPEFFIKDIPQVEYRVFMLDSGRQYQSITTLKKLLDLLAELKINTFHWHLTEGLGWRIPIEKFPQLTEFGAFVANERDQQGFYTKEQIKELNDYAAQRFIQIVPEIDLPGHSEAALAAYPQWSCEQKKPKIIDGFSDVIFCAGKEKSVKAMKQILTETAALFPGKYLHIGGDEAPKGKWKKCPDCQERMKKEQIENEHELQITLMNELAQHVLDLGKIPIIWNDPIKKGNKTQLLPQIVVQYWNMRGDKNLETLKFLLDSKIKIIFMPNKFSYLNFPQVPWKGYHQDRTISILQCFNHCQSSFPKTHFLGVGCALWCDYNLSESMFNERLFPRIYFQSELMWNGKIKVNFSHYMTIVKQLSTLFTRFPE